jgi:transcriptional regulator with XRE-family HTH domain
MRSSVHDVLPPAVRRSLLKLGADLGLARRKRQLTTVMMAERLGVAKSTYLRVEKGDPTVAMGVYAMALFVLGFGGALGEIVDPSRDEQGLLLDQDRVPKRVRSKGTPEPSAL